MDEKLKVPGELTELLDWLEDAIRSVAVALLTAVCTVLLTAALPVLTVAVVARLAYRAAHTEVKL